MVNDKVGSVKHRINCKAMHKQQRVNKKSKSKNVHLCAMKAYKGVEGQLHTDLTSGFVTGDWSGFCPPIVSLRERSHGAGGSGGHKSRSKRYGEEISPVGNPTSRPRHYID
jgi:hypothetical protein